MEESNFLNAVTAAISADPKNGSKWNSLETWFSEKGLRGNGALNNSGGADRTTRIRQLATSKTHSGHSTREVANHSVFVIGGETIDGYQANPDHYLEEIEKSLKDEHSNFESCLIIVAAPNHPPEPVRLIKRSDQPLPIPYEEWWPDLQVSIIPKNSTNLIPERAAASVEISHPTAILKESLKKCHKIFCDNAEQCDFRVNLDGGLRFISSLLSKRFLILTGLAGSGKTKVAQALARWITEDPGWIDSTDHTKGKNPNPCYELVSVGADWNGNENILGYPSGLEASAYVTKPALDLILHASAQENSDVPHFLILDEMNLSHVERYFADLLSAIESDEPIHLHQDAERKAGDIVIPRKITLPKNLFIIGTVNVDETTYMFSPKVLDRANVIEFRMDESDLMAFLEHPAKPNLENLDEKGVSFSKAFVEAARKPAVIPEEIKKRYDTELLLLFKTLQDHGAEFGYRTAYEASRFVHFYKLLGDGKVWNSSANESRGAWTDLDNEGRDWLDDAMDSVIFQKLLPKLHGSRAKLGPVLKKLWFLCVNDVDARSGDALQGEPFTTVPRGAPYPLSAEKIGRMWKLLLENGFASFAEA